MEKLKTAIIDENSEGLIKVDSVEKTVESIVPTVTDVTSVNQMVLDKNGQPMSKEHVEEELNYLVDYFRLDVKPLSNADDELLKYYKEIFFKFGRAGEIRFYKECYYYYSDLLPIARRHLKEFIENNVISEETKKHMKKSYIEKHEKRCKEHVELNRKRHSEIKLRIIELRNKLLSIGVELPDGKNKCKSIVNVNLEKNDKTVDSVNKWCY